MKIKISRAVEAMDEAVLDQAYRELEQLAEALTEDDRILLCHGDIIALRTGRNHFLLERSWL